MIYTHNCHRILQSPHGQSITTVMGDHPEILPYIKGLRASLPLFQWVDQDQDLSPLHHLAEHIRANFTDVIILGTGGSSLGGQALCALASASSPRLHFHDNIDPDTFSRLFSEINPSHTAVLAVSKSGNTAETLMQLLVCLNHWQNFLDKNTLKNHFWVIAENKENGIREVAKAYDLPCLDHPDDIGGRFAAFTLVGLLPALIAGLNAKDVRLGARLILDQVSQAQSSHEAYPIFGAFINFVLMKAGYTQSVLFPYVDRLKIFASWYRQLWAESLGKKGLGTTPVQALGTVDQHSQLQLYLDGPKDKFFTVISMDHQGHPFNIGKHSFSHPSLEMFQGKSMGQLLAAEQQATIDTLYNHHCPTRILHLSEVNEKVMGALMMHYVIETLSMAYLLDVNPFDQPAVEESKILTRKYLAES